MSKTYDDYFLHEDESPPRRRPLKIGERADGKGPLLNNGKPPVPPPTEEQWEEVRKSVGDILAGTPVKRAKPGGDRPPKKVKEKPAAGAVRTTRERDLRDHYKAVQVFFDNIGGGDQPIYIGIDPGVEGGIGLIHPTDPSLTTALDIPTTQITLQTKSKKKKVQHRTRYDLAEIWRWFQVIKEWRHRVVICLEQTQAIRKDTPITAFSMGTGYAMWPLFLLSHELVLEEREPGDWKRKMGLFGKDKEFSRLKAQKLWPKAPLFNVGHHNRAEALLIAEQVRRERQGQ